MEIDAFKKIMDTVRGYTKAPKAKAKGKAKAKANPASK